MKMSIIDNTAPSEKKTYITEVGFGVHQEVTEYAMGRGSVLYPLSFRFGYLINITVFFSREERQRLIHLLQNAWMP